MVTEETIQSAEVGGFEGQGNVDSLGLLIWRGGCKFLTFCYSLLGLPWNRREGVKLEMEMEFERTLDFVT